MRGVIRIGTRTSQLAMWQATRVKELLEDNGFSTDIVPVKSEGDLDLKTPLYRMGVQGVFTRYLDAALLAGRIDIAVHSMKDVPVVPAAGVLQAAVLPRASAADLLVCKDPRLFQDPDRRPATIATGSVRRKAQWLHRYPDDTITGLRGNINTRLHQLTENDWDGAIFAAAGLERTGLRPGTSFELDWMLPAPAQGAIMVVGREGDTEMQDALAPLNDETTALCTFIERQFLAALMGGCSTPISAHARLENGRILFEGNIVSPDGKDKLSVRREAAPHQAGELGNKAGAELMEQGAKDILARIKAAGIK